MTSDDDNDGNADVRDRPDWAEAVATGEAVEPARLLLIGFDGLDYELFRSCAPDGFEILPLLAPIPVTGPSWTSIYTGDAMATHGVRDVFGLEFRRYYSRNRLVHLFRWHLHNLGLVIRRKPPRRRHKSYETTCSTYLWDTLGRAGLTFKIVNMP